MLQGLPDAARSDRFQVGGGSIVITSLTKSARGLLKRTLIADMVDLAIASYPVVERRLPGIKA